MTEHDHDKRPPQRIAPARFHIAVEAPDRSGASARVRLVVLLGASLALAVLVIGVVLVLPRMVAAPPAATAAAPEASAVVADNDEKPTSTANLPRSAQEPESAAKPGEEAVPAREDTQARLRETLDKLARLEAIEGEKWAKSELHAIRERIAAGEKAYREKRYGTANNIYLDTAARVDRLLAEVPNIVESLLDSGRLALEQGDSARAQSAFDEVLSMDPDNATAVRGRARAKTLDQVMALIAEAEGYERLDQNSAALAAYRKALAIDADAAAATTAVARLERAQRESAYRAAMSAGFEALRKDQFSAARSAFEKAAKFDPTRGEVKAALSQLDNAEASYHIKRHLERAERAVSAERWDEAVEQYAAALKYDERLSPALAGKQRAEVRRRLDVQLGAYLARPERLVADKVHADASKVLAEAKRQNVTSGRLAEQVATLERELVLARTPLTVTLLSDNATRVTLYRVSDLGQFQNRELSLLPGTYTVVGKRDGYRDVRVEFSLRHGVATAPVTVQCLEKFAFGN